jgi:hypothetical protein
MPPLRRSVFCFAHDPELVEVRRRARSDGGRNAWLPCQYGDYDAAEAVNEALGALTAEQSEIFALLLADQLEQDRFLAEFFK